MIKAIFFDMDGTLFSHRTHRVPDSTKRALAQLRANGIRCIAATGRHLQEFMMLVDRDIAFDGYVTLNGQVCWDAGQRCIYENPIREPDKSLLIRMFCDHTVPMLLLERDRLYLNYVNDDVIRVQQDISTVIPKLGAYDGGEIDQIIAYFPRGEEAAVAEQLTESVILRWNERAIDIVPKGGDKSEGVRAYLRANGIDPLQAMAFGDGGNDIRMLQYVGTSIAMGNAPQAVKDTADYVTADVDDDGIEKALIHFGLI